MRRKAAEPHPAPFSAQTRAISQPGPSGGHSEGLLAGVVSSVDDYAAGFAAGVAASRAVVVRRHSNDWSGNDTLAELAKLGVSE